MGARRWPRRSNGIARWRTSSSARRSRNRRTLSGDYMLDHNKQRCASLSRRLIALISVIVPRRFRTRWRREWEAELEYREAALAKWNRLDWTAKIEMLRRSLGAFWDALLLQPRRSEDEMFQDLRYGARMLLKNKMFTLVAALSLALGIGANTAIFSLINAMMLRTLPVKDAQELAVFSVVRAQGPDYLLNYPLYEMIRDRNQSFTGVIVTGNVGRARVMASEPGSGGAVEPAQKQEVSGNFFSVLGVGAVVGRTLTEADDNSATAEPAAVISYGFWQRRFGLDPGVVGRRITVNNTAFTIVGVAPPGFFGIEVGTQPELWTPIKALNNPSLAQNTAWTIQVMGRLRPGVSMAQAQAEMDVIFRQQLEEIAGARGSSWTPAQLQRHFESRIRLEAGSAGWTDMRQKFQRPLLILMITVALTLLIACVNIANLLLARAASRRKEIAVRLALGAGRFRLVRQLLTESVLLAMAGGALGLLFALWGRDLLLKLRFSGQEMSFLQTGLNGRALAFTFAVSVLTGLSFGLAPAWRATRVDLTPALKDTGRISFGHSRSWVGRSVVVAQMALSLLLLIGAGLFLRTLNNLQHVAPGFNTQNLLLFRVDPRLSGYQGERLTQLYQRMFDRIEAVPGVRSVTFSRHPLLAGSSGRRGFYLAGQNADRNNPRTANIHFVRANFFETMEIPVQLGRSLSQRDAAAAPSVVVINQTLARRFFPDENPLGKRIRFNPDRPDYVEIVGVAQDAKYTSLRDEIPPTIYVPWLQILPGLGQMNFEVRTAGEPTSFLAAIRQAVREVDGNLPLFDVKTQVEQVSQSLAQERLFAALLSFFGALALALAALGLYGVLAHSVAQRTKEIGVRMALGAEARHVLRLVIGQGMLLVCVGIAAGLILAYWLAKWLSGWLYDVGAADPLTYGAIALLLAVVALLACWIPARRATKVDPMVALRCE